MNQRQHIAHRFELRGTTVGDFFFGCPQCWHRLEPNVAVSNSTPCPRCNGRLKIFDVTEADVADGAARRGATHDNAFRNKTPSPR